MFVFGRTMSSEGGAIMRPIKKDLERPQGFNPAALTCGLVSALRPTLGESLDLTPASYTYFRMGTSQEDLS